MKDKFNSLLRFIGTFALCFLVIYIAVFLGGWRLFKSDDPILIEIGAALILSIFVFIFSTILSGLEKRVKSLEERLRKLENSQ